MSFLAALVRIANCKPRTALRGPSGSPFQRRHWSRVGEPPFGSQTRPGWRIATLASVDDCDRHQIVYSYSAHLHVFGRIVPFDIVILDHIILLVIGIFPLIVLQAQGSVQLLDELLSVM